MQLINPLNQIDLPDLEMTYVPEFIPNENQHRLYKHLMEKGKWQGINYRRVAASADDDPRTTNDTFGKKIRFSFRVLKKTRSIQER